MTSQALSWATPAPGLGDVLPDPFDEFDLDIRWGELDQASTWTGYLPTLGEQPGETCNTHGETCGDTCGRTCDDIVSCPATCAQTHCHTCRC